MDIQFPEGRRGHTVQEGKRAPVFVELGVNGQCLAAEGERGSRAKGFDAVSVLLAGQLFKCPRTQPLV